jgi:hypothetical protein
MSKDDCHSICPSMGTHGRWRSVQSSRCSTFNVQAEESGCTRNSADQQKRSQGSGLQYEVSRQLPDSDGAGEVDRRDVTADWEVVSLVRLRSIGFSMTSREYS